jgi:hypothetical protein
MKIWGGGKKVFCTHLLGLEPQQMVFCVGLVCVGISGVFHEGRKKSNRKKGKEKVGGV